LANNVQVKKIQAYPIAAVLALTKGPVPASILKLTPLGFLAEIATPFLQAGEKIEVSFDTPIHRKSVKEKCVVIKLYAQHAGANVQHIAEIHFKPLSQDGHSAITGFLNLLAKAGGV
jgi:hypothetical protein